MRIQVNVDPSVGTMPHTVFTLTLPRTNTESMRGVVGHGFTPAKRGRRARRTMECMNGISDERATSQSCDSAAFPAYRPAVGELRRFIRRISSGGRNAAAADHSAQ